jgi:peptidoglycan/xylan/chitin deacetylase (PgdA/CDA1 family)
MDAGIFARRLMKTGLTGLARATGLDGLLARLLGVRPTPLVLAYHRVVEDCAAYGPHTIPPMLVSCAMLERHLDWVGRRYRFVTLDELGERLESGTADPRLAAVTFDDGYADLYEHAFPLLRRKGIPATIFVVSDLIGTSRPFLHDRLFALLHQAAGDERPRVPVTEILRQHGIEVAGLGGLLGDPLAAVARLLNGLSLSDAERAADILEQVTGKAAPADFTTMRPLSWEALEAMAPHGISVGSHSRSHALLTQASERKRNDEIAGSRRILEERLGTEIRQFAYPDGRWNLDIVETVARSGYRFAYTTCRHRDGSYPLLTIPRTVLWEGSCLGPFGGFSRSVMAAHAKGLLAAPGRGHVDHGPGDRAQPSPTKAPLAEIHSGD